MQDQTPQPPKARSRRGSISVATDPAITGSTGSITGESLVPDTVPEFESFAHIADPRTRRAKCYEQFLLFMLARFPEYETRIAPELEFARAEQSRNGASDADRILKALEENETLLCDELADDLDLPRSTVYKTLRKMLDGGIVAAHTRRGTSGNKPMIIYSLAH